MPVEGAQADGVERQPGAAQPFVFLRGVKQQQQQQRCWACCNCQRTAPMQAARLPGRLLFGALHRRIALNSAATACFPAGLRVVLFDRRRLLEYCEQRGFFGPSQGDLAVRLDTYSLCNGAWQVVTVCPECLPALSPLSPPPAPIAGSCAIPTTHSADGKYYRVDRFGHKLAENVVPLSLAAETERRGAEGPAPEHQAGPGAGAGEMDFMMNRVSGGGTYLAIHRWGLFLVLGLRIASPTSPRQAELPRHWLPLARHALRTAGCYQTTSTHAHVVLCFLCRSGCCASCWSGAKRLGPALRQSTAAQVRSMGESLEALFCTTGCSVAPPAGRRAAQAALPPAGEIPQL